MKNKAIFLDRDGTIKNKIYFFEPILFSLINVDTKINIPPTIWNIVIFSPKNTADIITAVIGSI